jgi:hypothetical protein
MDSLPSNTTLPLNQSVTCDDDLARSSESLFFFTNIKNSYSKTDRDRDIGSELTN